MDYIVSAIPSTLNQRPKFEYGYQKVVIHEEREYIIYTVEGKKSLDKEIFHAIKLVQSIEERFHSRALHMIMQYE